jgi:hypothetical protein
LERTDPAADLRAGGAEAAGSRGFPPRVHERASLTHPADAQGVTDGVAPRKISFWKGVSHSSKSRSTNRLRNADNKAFSFRAGAMLGARSRVKKLKNSSTFFIRFPARVRAAAYAKLQVAFRPTGKPRPERNPGRRDFPPPVRAPLRRVAAADSHAACCLIRIQEKTSSCAARLLELSQI